jgi:hypothetical protein
MQMCWNALSAETIAHAYAGHYQLINAIIVECEGSDDFVRQLGGLCCGIRKHCVPYFEQNDESTEPYGGDSLDADAITEEMLNEGLKYRQPDISV